MSLVEVKIGDLGKVITGNTPPKKDPSNYDGTYPFIKPTDMDIDKRYVTKWDENYSEKAYHRYHRSYIPSGATGVVTIGTVGEKLFQAHQHCFTNQSVNVIIPNDKYYDDYVFYLMKLNLPKVESANPGTASGRHHVSKSNFCSIKVNVIESIDSQKRIADILSAYDDLIENNLKRIKLLEQAAQNIYKEWFVNLRFPGYENISINEETGLPVGWKKVKIREFAKINGRSIKKGKSPVFVNYIDISSVGSGYYEKPKKIAFKDAPSRARRIVENGDSIFSTVRPNRKTYAFILNPKENLTASTGFAVISPKHEYDASFLYFTISKNTFVDETVALATGTAYPAINQKSFESIEIIVPSEQLIISFDSIVIKLLKSKSVLSNQNEKLKEGRDILLPRLMNRTIEV